MHDYDFDIVARLMRVGGLLHRYSHRNHRLHGPSGDPNRGQGRVMALLKMRPEISQKELSYLLDIRPQSLGELLAKLERAGYVERTPSQSDRRVMDIRLTEEGARLAERNPDPESPIKNLSPDEQKTLAGLLDKIIADLDEELESFRPFHDCYGERRPEHGHRRGGHCAREIHEEDGPEHDCCGGGHDEQECGESRHPRHERHRHHPDVDQRPSHKHGQRHGGGCPMHDRMPDEPPHFTK